MINDRVSFMEINDHGSSMAINAYEQINLDTFPTNPNKMIDR